MKFGNLYLIRFIILGLINTTLTYFLYLILLFLLPYVWAYSITYLFGLTISYFLSSYWVFKKNIAIKSGMYFLIYHLSNYLVNIMALWIFIDLIGLSEKIAPVITISLLTPIFYLISKKIFLGKIKSE
jgi:putative flippase GtrA